MTCSVLYQGIALLRTANHTELRADLANLLQIRAQSLKNANRIAEAPLAFDEAVSLYRHLYADDPTKYGDELVESLWEYRSLLQIGHEDEARVIGAELISVARELYAKDPNALKHRTLIDHIDWYGHSLHRAGRAEEAEAAWNELIALNRRLRDGDPTSITTKCLIASLCSYAVFLSHAGKADEAKGVCEEYLTLSSCL
jgi:tetratricopeptide (TPR) repeat protein